MAVLKYRNGIAYIKYYDASIGSNRMFSLRTRDKTIAKQLLKRFEAKRTLDLYRPKNNTPVTELFENYISNKTELAKSSIELRVYAMRMFLDAVGDKPADRVDEEDYNKLLKYYKKRGLSHNSKAIYIAEIRTFFNHLVYEGIIKKNYIKSIPRKTKPPVAYSREDLSKLLNELKKNKKQYLFVMFLLNTGVRKSDAINLTWERIHWDRGVIDMTNQKKGREFYFPITNEVKKILKEIGIKKKGSVFGYSYHGVKFYWRVQKRLNLSRHYTMHELRKTFISYMLERGIRIEEVAKMIDSRDLQTLYNHYAYTSAKTMGKRIDSVKPVGV